MNPTVRAAPGIRSAIGFRPGKNRKMSPMNAAIAAPRNTRAYFKQNAWLNDSRVQTYWPRGAATLAATASAQGS